MLRRVTESLVLRAQEVSVNSFPRLHEVRGESSCRFSSMTQGGCDKWIVQSYVAAKNGYIPEQINNTSRALLRVQYVQSFRSLKG